MSKNKETANRILRNYEYWRGHPEAAAVMAEEIGAAIYKEQSFWFGEVQFLTETLEFFLQYENDWDKAIPPRTFEFARTRLENHRKRLQERE